MEITMIVVNSKRRLKARILDFNLLPSRIFLVYDTYNTCACPLLKETSDKNTVNLLPKGVYGAVTFACDRSFGAD